jgi:PAS domain S-box-containing protein
VGCSLAELGVSVSVEEGREEQDLDSMLDEIFRKYMNAAGTALRSAGLTGGDNPRKRGREDSESSSTAGDTACDAWADDWGGTPALELPVDVQRGLQNSSIVRAILSVRMWSTGESPLYVLTFAKPVSSPPSANSSMQSQSAEKDPRKAMKRATLARMKSSAFDQSSIPTYLFSADETIYYPNEAGKALAGLLEEDNMLEQGSVIMTRLEIWDEKYTRKLSLAEFPGIKLVRTRLSFKEQKYGFVYPHTGERLRLDLSGDCLYDEATGEFLGGVVWCRDVTEYTKMIAQQQIEIERGFENKLDYMPNMSWTAKPDGEPDYFSKRWYDFTHASRNETFKEIWTRTVHPDDRDAMWDSWIQCTQKGQPFTMEARYKRFDGVYRYQLVHGVPQQNDKGEIVKWHGTSTDIHDLVTQRIETSRLKQQMLAVLSHAEVNLFGFDTQMAITMLEGSIKWGTQESASEKAALIGSELVDAVQKTTEEGADGAADFIEAVQKILRGDSTMEIVEHTLDKRWYRTRFIADVESNNESGQDTIRGVLGLSIDITDMKARVALELEKTQLIANEIAAKEANMLKSQFLANVSHELRTPISGVLGMADLLAETPLADEQREYTRGISQSADSLLRIVNDILDASKIEAGRFDIESVEFNLSRVLEDLYKMMAYAAQRKNLKLIHNTQLSSVERVIGDPGRTRQILVNL